MRRITTTLFAFLYLITSVGLTVNVHYCKGKISSIRILLENSICCCGNNDQMKGCCDDQSYFVQLDTDQQVSSVENLYLKYPTISHEVNSFEEPKFIYESTQKWVVTQKRPPPKSALRLLYCSLTYYG